MAEMLLAIVIFGLLIAAMAIGVLMGGKPISGSCGGVGAALGEANYNCDICGGDPNKCDEQSASELGFDIASDTTSAKQDQQ